MKNLILTFTLLLVLACSNDQEPIQSTTLEKDENIEMVNYVFNGQNYSLTFDVSNEEDPILLEGPDNDFLAQLYQNNENLAMVMHDGDETIYIFEDTDKYESSKLFEKSEASLKTKPSYPNYSRDVILYKRGVFNSDGGGYYINVNNLTVPYYLPDFRYNIRNNGNVASLFPSSWYNIGYRNLNDDVSSIYVNLAKLTCYEHPNYGGRALILDARSGPTYYIEIDKLSRVKFSCGLFCSRSWDERITSAIIQR